MGNLAERRILIVEDNVMISTMLAEVVESAGGCPVGPVRNRDEALDALAYDDRPPDAAILDLSVEEGRSDVARRLAAMHVPFVYATGDPRGIPNAYRDRPVCAKPFSPSTLVARLSEMFEADADRPGSGPDRAAIPCVAPAALFRSQPVEHAQQA